MITMPFSRLRLRDDDFQNPRTRSGLDHDGIRELADDISTRGLLNPLVVTAQGLILGGQRRYLAISLLIEDSDPCATRLLHGVPVTIREDSDRAGDALADNLHRRQLESFEIAAALAEMSDDMGVREIARRVNKSPAYVSTAIKTWNQAVPALKTAWRDGRIAYQHVKEIADLPEEAQGDALGRALGDATPSQAPEAESDDAPARDMKRGGSHGRPGIQLVKRQLAALTRPRDPEEVYGAYEVGVIDALRWVCGYAPSAALLGIFDMTEG